METKESPLADKKARMRFNKAMREKGIPAKACGKCFVVKGLTQYGAHRKGADGRQAYCQPCGRNVGRRWYQENRGKRLDVGRQWALDNPEYAKRATRRWRSRHPERARLLARQTAHLRRARKAAATIVPFTHDELMASWEDDGLYACVFCDGPFEEIEHILPLSRGGEHSIANLVPSCVDCNRGVGGKASRLPWEWLSERYPELAPILIPSVLPDVDPAP